MSLVGFAAQNHPQQIRERGARPTADDRATDPREFAVFDQRFRFSIDVCAEAHNAKLPRFYSPADDGLAQSWRGERVWCNPPYSDIEPWLEKAWIEWRDGAELIVMLLPANRTEQGWWQRQVEPHRDIGGDLRVEFLRGRMRFIRSDRERVAANERPPFGCCLLIWSGDPPEEESTPQ